MMEARIEGVRLTTELIEVLGLTLMRLKERMNELKARSGVTGEELRLDLGGLIGNIQSAPLPVPSACRDVRKNALR
ncbi:MAG: gas vesicle protein GvpK [Rhodomicrobium sp.]